MESVTTKQRMRIRIACEECRRNKRKCDGQQPACFLCTKSGRECKYAPELSRKRRNHDEELIRNLESQIKVLESALRSRSVEIGQTQDLPHETVSMAQCEKPVAQMQEVSRLSPSLSPASGPNAPLADARSTSAMEELASLMLEMDIEEKGEPSFTIAAGKRSSPHAEYRRSLSDPVVENGQEQWIPHPGTETLHLLMDCFIDNFNSFHQFLSSNDIQILRDRGADESDLDCRFRNASVLAVAARFTHLEDARQVGADFTRLAESLVMRCIKERPSDLVVQGLTLLAWKELMFGVPSMAYNYISMATGHVLYLGLHVTALVKSATTTQAHKSLYLRRVRSFWAYFSVDRLLTSRMGMNCTLHWQRVRMPPFRIVIDGEPTLEEAAHEVFCQLWHLWDSGMDQVYAFGWSQLTSDEREALVLRSHQSLTDFHSNIDERLRLRRGYLPDAAVWFQMAYNTALLLIHRPLLNEPKGSSAAIFALRSTTAAASSISRIIRSYRRVQKFGSISPQVIDYILSAAVIHLLNATSGKTVLGRQAANGLRSCLEALVEIHEQWNLIAVRSIRQIQDLAHRWNVVRALPVNLAQPIIQEGNDTGTERSNHENTGDTREPHRQPTGIAHLEHHNLLTARLNVDWAPSQDQSILQHFHSEADDPGLWALSESYWDTLVEQHDASTSLVPEVDPPWM